MAIDGEAHGGGHFGAGSTPLPLLEADVKILEIVEALKS